MNADPRLGQLLGGRYRVVRRLGEGGMGTVYEGLHEAIGRKVALKCLHPQLADDREVLARFQREAQSATSIGNEHIVEVLDLGKAPDGAPYLALEFLDGHDLGQVIQAGGPLGLPRACHLVLQVCEALGAAHAKGIIHRDLKPENIFLVERKGDPDFVKVVDFGIAGVLHSPAGQRLTRTGTMMGTPYFMAPEQALGRTDVDHRADLWAIGVILFHCLTARFPFHSNTLGELVLQICSGVPPPLRDYRPDLPGGVEPIILRCLEKAREDRYEDCAAMARELAPLQHASAWPPPPPGASGGAAHTPPPVTRVPTRPPGEAPPFGPPAGARTPPPGAGRTPPPGVSPTAPAPPPLADGYVPATRPPRPPARRSGLPIVALAVAAILVFTLVGAFAAYVVVRRAHRRRSRATVPSTQVVAPAPDPPPPAPPAPVPPPVPPAPAPPAPAPPAPAPPAAPPGAPTTQLTGPEHITRMQQECAAGTTTAAMACWHLGAAYQNGRGVDRNIQAAILGYERGCELGYLPACVDVGFLYQTGRQGATRDLGRAMQRYRRACDGGEMLGCNNLAAMYHLGQGVRRNPREAARLFAHSCEHGNPAACTNIGLLTLRGDGVPRNAELGARLLQRACDAGHATGCRELAGLYRQGRGVPLDPVRAARLEARAIELEGRPAP